MEVECVTGDVSLSEPTPLFDPITMAVVTLRAKAASLRQLARELPLPNQCCPSRREEPDEGSPQVALRALQDRRHPAA